MTGEVNRFVFTNDKRIYDHFGDEFTVFNETYQPIFPGYTFDMGKSIIVEKKWESGGYVYSRPGAYGNVALLDVDAS